jgi:putative tryptophan/tyrosine transport system substrate-binding protein
MRRRDFITLFGGAAMWPVAVRAQQSERERRIGALFGSIDEGYLGALAEGLAQLGWSDSRNVRFDTREARGDINKLKAYAGDLVRLAPDVIVVHGTETARILLQQTNRVPIVFTTVTDPVGSGLVASLSRPGGNITGFTNFEFSMAGKWLELLKEAAPAVRNVAVFNPDNVAMPGQLHAITTSAPPLGLTIIEVKVRTRDEIERALDDLAGLSNTGLLVLPEFLTTVHRNLIIASAARHGLPSAYGHRYFTASGGLMSYGVDNSAVYRRAASYVDRILRGEKAADLPVQQPTKFELVVNLKTSKALGLEIPPTLLARADEVIEGGADATTRVHHAHRRRGGRVVAGGARATSRSAQGRRTGARRRRLATVARLSGCIPGGAPEARMVAAQCCD